MKNQKFEKVGMLMCLLAIFAVVTYAWAVEDAPNRPISGAPSQISPLPDGNVSCTVGGKDFILDGNDPAMRGSEEGGLWEEIEEKASEVPPEPGTIEGDYIPGTNPPVFRATSVSD